MDRPKQARQSKLNIQDHIKKAAIDDHSHWAFDVEMHRKIELEAYFRAERDGFSASPQDYWVLAEKEVGCAMP